MDLAVELVVVIFVFMCDIVVLAVDVVTTLL